MPPKSITLQLRPRGTPVQHLQDEIDIDAGLPNSELYAEVSKQVKLSIHRIRITKGGDGSLVKNSEGVTIKSIGLQDQSTVYVKDLGPQIAWRTVFIVEYLGPLLIHPLLYLARPFLYRSAPAHASYLQTLSCILISLHFLKREFETVLVHRFSASTMPAKNIFKNSFHYWVLAGVNIAGWIYSPTSPTAKDANNFLLSVGLLAYGIGEIGNLYTHLVLRGLRSAGGKERGIPLGFGFGLVTCPNYMFEVLLWVGIYLISALSWSVLLFALVSTGQMMTWARKKEAIYRREFGGKYKKKKYTMLPGIW